MEKAAVLIALLLSGCDQASEHIWNEVDKCEALYSEACVVVIIPKSSRKLVLDIAPGRAVV